MHEQRREYEAKKREERSDAEEKGEKTAVCGIRNLVYAEAHNMWCRVVYREARNMCCHNSDGSARGGSWRRVQTARRRGRRQRYVALVIWSVEKLITCAITWCVERLMTCAVAWCVERRMTCGVKTETGVRGQKAGGGVRRGGERREKYAQSPQVSYRGLPPPPPFRFAARARKLSRARARESGDTTPCRMTCVTLHRHVRYKKTCGPLSSLPPE